MGRRKASNVAKYQRLVEAKHRILKTKEIAEDLVSESLKPVCQCVIPTKTVVCVAICQEPCLQSVKNMNMDRSIDDLDTDCLMDGDGDGGTVEDQQQNSMDPSIDDLDTECLMDADGDGDVSGTVERPISFIFGPTNHTQSPMEMLHLDDDNVAQFVEYNNPHGEVWQAVCALWQRVSDVQPIAMTLGVTSYVDINDWARNAETTAIKFLNNPQIRIFGCRSVIYCVQNNMVMVGTIGLGVYGKERSGEKLLQAKLKGYLRPLLDVVYKNDPVDYTDCLRNVRRKIMDKVANHIHAMPYDNANAAILHLLRREDEDDSA